MMLFDLRNGKKYLNIELFDEMMKVNSFDTYESGEYEFHLISKISYPSKTKSVSKVLIFLLNFIFSLDRLPILSADTCLRYRYDGVPVSIELKDIEKEKISEFLRNFKNKHDNYKE